MRRPNLRHHIESWRGRQFTETEAAAFDLATILGRSCMLGVTQREASNGKTYADIGAIMAIPREFQGTRLIAEMPLILYTPDATESYNQLPEFLRKKIDNQILEQPPASGPGSGDSSGRPDQWDGAGGPDYDDLSRETTITDDDIPF